MNLWFNLSYHDFKIVIGVILAIIYGIAIYFKVRND